MPSSSSSSITGVGRFSTIVLGLVVLVCVLMIGGTGYLKYQLDRSEVILAAPDNALGSDQDLFDRLRRDLGYGGFLGMAQNYASTRDTSGFAEMKAHIKSANEIITHLPDRTTAETRHELTAIAAVFNAAMQKINGVSGDVGGDFNATDLAPLYAAMPILDARVAAANAETRLAAQNKVQFWAMLLTLVSWCSLIIAAACAAGIYLTLRDKHSAPMRALAQSIQNMARGDMRTAIWGIERQDTVGELARAVDIARYHFSHLPDLSLLSEQGPVRMRFEGGSRSLFEAMMKAISRDSEHIREQSATLTDAVKQQKETITLMSEKVEMVLQNILEHGQNGDQQIKHAISEMLSSTENLRNAHTHAADQLNRLIPTIQDRAQGMAEIANITGKQISQTLQSLTTTELGLRANVEQAKSTFIKLSSTADDLGERLFGAINLLQASGRVLAETTDDLRTKFNEKIATPAQEAALAPLAERLEQITNHLSAMQAKVETQTAITSRLEQGFEQNDTHGGLMSAALAKLDGKIMAMASSLPFEVQRMLQDDLQRVSTQFDAKVVDIKTLTEKISMLQANMERTPGLSLELSERMSDLGHQLTAQIEATRQHLGHALEQEVGNKLVGFEHLLTATRRAVEQTQAEVSKPVPKQSVSLPPETQKQFLDQWFQMSAQIEATRASLADSISEQIGKLETRLAGKASSELSRTASDYVTQRQIEQQTHILSELVSTLSILDTHMQQIKSEMHATVAAR